MYNRDAYIKLIYTETSIVSRFIILFRVFITIKTLIHIPNSLCKTFPIP